jgi:hypothetical protein
LKQVTVVTTTRRNAMSQTSGFTVCVLLYGDHCELAMRCLTSLVANCDPDLVHSLRVGMNTVGNLTRQCVNDYDKDVFNGDIGRISGIDEIEQELLVRYEERDVVYDFNELDEVQPAFAMTIHKSQGSEYPVVIVPVHTQHYMMLQRNLLYTAVTRGKKLVILVGTKKAIAIAVKRVESSKRITTLKQRLMVAAGR